MPVNSPLENWLNYLEHLHPQMIDLGLERVQAVARRLDLLNLDCPVITVAGTNGKGSCVAMLKTILAEQGYRVGAYFSPHLMRYNERIEIADRSVTDDELCEAFSTIELARKDISLTYFEWGTLAALWLFKNATLDILVLEVGLGGRLDAVNMVDPDISVVTTIDYDHMEWLGDTRELIGREKAGIFRPQKPAVCGDMNPPQSLLEAAYALNTPLYCQGKHFGSVVNDNTWQFWCEKTLSSLLPMPQLLLQNAATALMVLELLKEIRPISIESIKKGLMKAFLPGRFQIVAQNPLVILDVAHNPEGCRKLAEQLKTPDFNGKTFAVVGMLTDKNHRESLRPLLSIVEKWYVASLNGARGLSSDRLAKILADMDVSAICAFDSILDAYQTALDQATVHDRIVVFGSFHAVFPITEQIETRIHTYTSRDEAI